MNHRGRLCSFYFALGFGLTPYSMYTLYVGITQYKGREAHENESEKDIQPYLKRTEEMPLPPPPKKKIFLRS